MRGNLTLNSMNQKSTTSLKASIYYHREREKLIQRAVLMDEARIPDRPVVLPKYTPVKLKEGAGLINFIKSLTKI